MVTGWIANLHQAREWWAGKPGCVNPFDYESETAADLRAAAPRVSTSEWAILSRLLHVAGVLTVRDEPGSCPYMILCCRNDLSVGLSDRLRPGSDLIVLSSLPSLSYRSTGSFTTNEVVRAFSQDQLHAIASHYKAHKKDLWPCIIMVLIEPDGSTYGLRRLFGLLNDVLPPQPTTSLRSVASFPSRTIC